MTGRKEWTGTGTGCFPRCSYLSIGWDTGRLFYSWRETGGHCVSGLALDSTLLLETGA